MNDGHYLGAMFDIVTCIDLCRGQLIGIRPRMLKGGFFIQYFNSLKNDFVLRVYIFHSGLDERGVEDMGPRFCSHRTQHSGRRQIQAVDSSTAQM